MATRDLQNDNPPPGHLEWIGRSPRRRAEIEVLEQSLLEAGTGLVGDHHARSGKSKRQVTLVQAEHLPVIASWLGLSSLDPVQLRRNLVVAGINLTTLQRQRFRIGGAWLEGSGPCAPCSRMEETLGPGGYQATRGHGGITAKVLRASPIALGDPVYTLPWSGPRLVTERGVLSPFAREDATELWNLFRDRAVRQYLLDDERVPLEWIEQEIQASDHRFHQGRAGLWSLRLHGEARIAGFAGFRDFFDPPQEQLLYGLLPAYQGHGLATEIARAVGRYALENLARPELHAAIDAPNQASARVLERLGMRRVETPTHLATKDDTLFFASTSLSLR